MEVLDEIFQLQAQLMRLLGMQSRPSGEHGTALGGEAFSLYKGDVLIACMGMASEAGEVLSEVNVLTRPWARKTDAQAEAALIEEAIDVLFFFVELAILLDLTPQDILRVYKRKWEKNVERFYGASPPGEGS